MFAVGRVQQVAWIVPYPPESSAPTMSWQHDTMMNPPIEELLDRADSKFRLVTLGATRARQINAYFGQLGDGLGQLVPPQVTSLARKPLSIAFEEIAADKIVWTEPAEVPEVVEDAADGEADASAGDETA